MLLTCINKILVQSGHGFSVVYRGQWGLRGQGGSGGKNTCQHIVKTNANTVNICANMIIITKPALVKTCPNMVKTCPNMVWTRPNMVNIFLDIVKSCPKFVG